MVVFVSSVLFSSFFVFPILIWGKALRAAFLGIPPDPLFWLSLLLCGRSWKSPAGSSHWDISQTPWMSVDGVFLGWCFSLGVGVLR